MTLTYNGKEIAHIYTNMSVTVEEMLHFIGYDVKTDAEKTYRDEFPGAYLDDVGNYCFDIEGYEMEWR